MGNALSEEETADGEFFQKGFKLDSPDADRVVNFGAAAPRCQPRHTEEELKQEDDENVEDEEEEDGFSDDEDDEDEEYNAEGQEMAMRSKDRQQLINENGQPQSPSQQHRMTTKHRRQSSSEEAAATHKRQHTSSAAASATEQKQKLSYVQMAKLGYQELVNAIIRPPRADYKMENLGPPAFNFCGKRFTRTDFTLRTKRGFNLECSHWEPVERTMDRIPVVIYMHGNSSARVEVIPQLSYLLSLGLSVFAFDFAGSGKSDGEYVSLGFFEREDLSCIVAHLRATNVVSTIALWGRSMGAATALMFGDRDPSIACMILDSPFADLTQLCEEMVEKAREQGIMVPNFVSSIAIRMIQGSVKKQAGFNIRNISPISHADRCFIPALFVAGEHDDFIKKHHSEAIYEKYAGDKNIIIVEGDHNSPRPKFMFDSASIFLHTCLHIPNEWALQVPVSMNLMCPPWFYELYQQRALRRKQQQQSQMATAFASVSGNGNGASASAVLDQEMGMTAERQRAIQASLFKMLGQVDSPGDKDEGTSNGVGSADRYSVKPSPPGASASSSHNVEVGVPVAPPKK